MPVTSEKQRRLFQMVAHGKKTKATGLTKSKAKEWLAETPKGKKLPMVARAIKRKRNKK